MVLTGLDLDTFFLVDHSWLQHLRKSNSIQKMLGDGEGGGVRIFLQPNLSLWVLLEIANEYPQHTFG